MVVFHLPHLSHLHAPQSKNNILNWIENKRTDTQTHTRGHTRTPVLITLRTLFSVTSRLTWFSLPRFNCMSFVSTSSLWSYKSKLSNYRNAKEKQKQTKCYIYISLFIYGKVFICTYLSKTQPHNTILN